MEALDSILDENVRFASGDLSLEGVLTYPRDLSPSRAVVLLAPHPHFAGDLDNNVLRRLAPELAAAGWVVLRFNYRGVGASEVDLPVGTSSFDYWHRVERDGLHERVVEDVLAARDYAERTLGSECRIDLVGYSFGAILATLTAARRPRIGRLVGIAPPLVRYDFGIVRRSSVPKAFVLASDDFLYGEAEIRRLASLLGPGDRLEVVDDADHFFRGREAALARRVRERLGELLEPREVFTS